MPQWKQLVQKTQHVSWCQGHASSDNKALHLKSTKLRRWLQKKNVFVKNVIASLETNKTWRKIQFVGVFLFSSLLSKKWKCVFCLIYIQEQSKVQNELVWLLHKLSLILFPSIIPVQTREKTYHAHLFMSNQRNKTTKIQNGENTAEHTTSNFSYL